MYYNTCPPLNSTRLRTYDWGDKRRDLGEAAIFAAQIRANSCHPAVTGRGALCTVDLKGLEGSFNSAHKLNFGDGVTWVIKIPHTGNTHMWNDVQGKHIKETANLMRWIATNTIVPLPWVHAFGDDFDSVLGYPFIIEDFIDGMSVNQLWTDPTISDDQMRLIMARTIHDIAKVMVDLSGFEFNSIGAPQVENGELTGTVGPFLNNAKQEEGPYDTLEQYFKHLLVQDEDLPRDFYTISLRIMIDWVVKIAGSQPCSLFHPDLNANNIIIDSAGRLKGVIDWDFTRAEPKSFGIHSFPIFISRDWDPDSEHPFQTGDNDFDMCEEALLWHLPNGEVKPKYITGNDFRKHELQDFYRAVWWKCVIHFSVQKDAGLQLIGLDLDELLYSIPQSYDKGLSHAECFSAPLLREAGFYARLLRQIVGHLWGKIFFMELTMPHLIDGYFDEESTSPNYLRNSESAAHTPASMAQKNNDFPDCEYSLYTSAESPSVENFEPTVNYFRGEAQPHRETVDDSSKRGEEQNIYRLKTNLEGLESHRKHLPHYTDMKKDLKRGYIHGDYLRIAFAWFRYLIYLPGKHDVYSQDPLACNFSANTRACTDALAVAPSKQIEKQWKIYIEGQGWPYKPYIDNPYPGLEEVDFEIRADADINTNDTIEKMIQDINTQDKQLVEDVVDRERKPSRERLSLVSRHREPPKSLLVELSDTSCSDAPVNNAASESKTTVFEEHWQGFDGEHRAPVEEEATGNVFDYGTLDCRVPSLDLNQLGVPDQNALNSARDNASELHLEPRVMAKDDNIFHSDTAADRQSSQPTVSLSGLGRVAARVRECIGLLFKRIIPVREKYFEVTATRPQSAEYGVNVAAEYCKLEHEQRQLDDQERRLRTELHDQENVVSVFRATRDVEKKDT